MSEENKMTEENKKTIIAFIAGLLVGGLLVFIFVDPTPSAVIDNNDDEVEETQDEEVDEMDEEDEEMVPSDEEEENDTPVTDNSSNENTSGGSVSVSDQDAGNRVYFRNADFPTNDGWVGVRDYQNDQLSGLLGAARWDKAEGLLPESVGLLRPTIAGNSYAIVFYTENGDEVFSLATDRQMSGVMETFEAE